MTYIDPIEVLQKGTGHVITITHLATSVTVSFPALLTEYSDNFISKWDATTVYGRMDDIYNFKQTTRSITIAWDTPSADSVEGAGNLKTHKH